jgi:predicted CoA-binding protein
MHTTPTTDWRARLIESTDEMRALLRQSRRIAVLGIKPETRSSQPAHFVAEYAKEAGYEVIPVPVYYPEVTEILGSQVYRRLVDVPGEIDIVNVFRRPEHVLPHVDDIIAKGTRAVWMQLGIRNDEAAERLARAGIEVVQDRCLKVELMRMGI